jgi:hypothetical protein
MINLPYHKVLWMKFKEYPLLRKSNIVGGAYGLVFNDTKPEDYQLPCEFEECVYIGKSTGSYIDRKSNTKSMLCSYIYKRMTDHNKALQTGVTAREGWSDLVRTYGFGDSMLDGVFTGKPLYLGVILPRPDMKMELLASWSLTMEKLNIFTYESTFGYSPIANLETQTKRKDGSFSSTMIERPNLELYYD